MKAYARWVAFWIVGLAVFIHGENREFQLKAAFIQRFTDFIQWPDESGALQSAAYFEIGVWGKTPLTAHLQQLSTEHKIKGKTVRVREITEPRSIGGCRIVFIAAGEIPRLQEIIGILAAQPVLTIADTEGYLQLGVLINFVIRGDHVNFEINPVAVQRSGLHFSAKLLKLACNLKESPSA